jgi:hypothetical protein
MQPQSVFAPKAPPGTCLGLNTNGGEGLPGHNWARCPQQKVMWAPQGFQKAHYHQKWPSTEGRVTAAICTVKGPRPGANFCFCSPNHSLFGLAGRLCHSAYTKSKTYLPDFTSFQSHWSTPGGCLGPLKWPNLGPQPKHTNRCTVAVHFFRTYRSNRIITSGFELPAATVASVLRLVMVNSGQTSGSTTSHYVLPNSSKPSTCTFATTCVFMCVNC